MFEHSVFLHVILEGLSAANVRQINKGNFDVPVHMQRVWTRLACICSFEQNSRWYCKGRRALLNKTIDTIQEEEKICLGLEYFSA